MSFPIKIKQGFLILFIFFSLFLVSEVAFAMDSTSYRIDSDSINFVGGDTGSSSSFRMDDTGGEISTGTSGSNSYSLSSGYRSSDAYRIALSCPTAVDLGSIIGTGKSELDTNEAACTVITDNPSGYDFIFDAETTYLEDVSGNHIDAYSPSASGAPDAWSVPADSSEWGVRLKKNGTTTYDAAKWGAANYGESYENNDVYWHNVTQDGGFVVASKPTVTSLSGDQEVLQFGAEIGAEKSQPTGTYTTKVYVTAISL